MKIIHVYSSKTVPMQLPGMERGLSAYVEGRRILKMDTGAIVEETAQPDLRTPYAYLAHYRALTWWEKVCIVLRHPWRTLA